MSQINVNRIKDSNEGAPDFPSGVNVGGITSTVTLGVTNLNPTNVNVSGVVTATTFDGSMSATGTPTLGLGVTINASGLNISGVATAGIVSATTLYGDGSNLTGIGLSIAPLNYNPAVYGVDLDKSPGIGLTFNQAVKAGSGEVTLRQVGAAGTVVQTWGVGSSITYGKSSYGDTISLSLVSDLAFDSVYHLSYPSGAFTNIGGDVSYVGTGYTFDTKTLSYTLWGWGDGNDGNLAQNNLTEYSSPVQIPGSWARLGRLSGSRYAAAAKTEGTLYMWGSNSYGQLGQNSVVKYSSPVQVPGTTWAYAETSQGNTIVTKTDGTLWAWGYNDYGEQGHNNRTKYSSPVQIPGTDWKVSATAVSISSWLLALKTNGTLWVCGTNDYGGLGLNNTTKYSSPVQVPGTTWSSMSCKGSRSFGVKTDGTLWGWGYQEQGEIGDNSLTSRSSPVQIPGTTWSTEIGKFDQAQNQTFAIKTDGTLWGWGRGDRGQFAQNDTVSRSSPVQVPGTTWSTVNVGSLGYVHATKTDGTLWAWGWDGYNSGVLGLNQGNAYYSSPVQIPGTNWVRPSGDNLNVIALQEA